MLAFEQQGRLADGDVSRHLYNSRSHHMGYHGWCRMMGLWGRFIRTEHRWTLSDSCLVDDS